MAILSFVFLCSFALVVSQGSVQNGINQFTNRLVKNIETSNPNSNFILSPLSLHSSFSQLLTGAGERTQAELEAALGIQRSNGLVKEYARLSSANKALKTANILALNRGFTPNRSFVNFLKKGFGSEVKEYDLVNNKIRAVAEINRIVAGHTNNKILVLLSPDAINDNTKMILINAVYFKANWKTSFNHQDAFSANFQSPLLGNVMTQYMNIATDAKPTETEPLDILELPYEDSKTSMIFFLPKEGRSSSNIMDSVARYKLNSLKNVQTSNVVISIPKFKFTFETALKQEMEKIGMQDLFTDDANFTSISSQPLQVSDGIHKAFIEVNEEGTEAAAATAVLFSTRSGGRSKKMFFADRPFMFMVYDSVNNIPVFIGKISNPDNNNQKKKSLNQQFQITSQDKKAQSSKVLRPSNPDQNNPCNKYKESIGVAVHNINQCRQKTNSLRFFQQYLAACSASQDLYNDFLSWNCGSSWCGYAALNYSSWQKMYKDGCREDRFSESCLKLLYDLRMVRYLNCGI